MRLVNDSEFLPPIRSPFPPGKSPFRQKGAAFLGDVEYFTAKVPGGMDAVLRGVTDEGTRTYLSQRFHASEWYDAYPNVYLQLSAARLSGLSFEQHRRRVGAFHAHALGGLYRALLRVITNEAIATWGPRATAMYWDFGKTETRAVGPREVVAIRSGTPRGLLQWMVWATAGFADETLRLAGARNAITTFGEVEHDGERDGQQLCKIKVKMVWE